MRCRNITCEPQRLDDSRLVLTTPRFASRIRVWIALAVFTSPLSGSGQVYSGTGNIHEVFVGTETESYLRALDLTDTSSDASWTIRPLSPGQGKRLARSLGADPWHARLTGFAVSGSPFHFGFLSPSVSVRYNSQFPYGSNDAAIWAGRGATIAAQAGVYADLGPISVRLMPIFFRAENTSFPLAFSALPCGCGEPTYGGVVDRPQRFGTQPYQRLDPGQSTIRLDALGFAAGLTTANEGWGPVAEYPFLLGNNAPGFPHVFLGTSQPLPIFVGKAQVRVIYGRLDQSSYSPAVGSKFYTSRLETGRIRFASGLIATFQPRGFDGLEIGGSRFIHSVWPRSGIPSNYLRKPLQAFLKKNLPGIDQQVAGTDNQLASFFARWAFRESGMEVYGEYGREDNSYDLRDFVQEPDHQRAYSLGLAKTFSRQSSQFNVLRIELINFQLPPLATTGRGEGSIYVHSPTRQGHTNRGQLLGADVGVGAAAGSTVRWDHYSSGGRWGLFWRRDVRQETSDPTLKLPSTPQTSDVLHALGFERLKFTRRFDVTTSLTLMRDLSRDLSNSRFNANAAVAITLPR
jgi:hypothetical protein